MAITLYELKGTTRSDYQTNCAQLKDFCAIESDWRDIFRWVMSISGEIPLYDEYNKENGKISALWSNNVLTVLVEIVQKNLKEYVSSFLDGNGTIYQKKYTNDLHTKISAWILRLDNYLQAGLSNASESAAMRIAVIVKEQLAKSLPIKIDKISKRNPFEENETNRPYFTMLGALSDIQDKFDYYTQQVENSGDMDASLALLLVFIRNYSEIIKEFNEKLQEWPNFYHKEILQVVPNDAVQDSTYLIITPNKEKTCDTFMLPAHTQFLAGTNDDGTDLFYKLEAKTYIVPAKIDNVHSVFKIGNSIYMAPIPLSENNKTPLFDENNILNKQLEYGWMFVSHTLVLAEGKRTITVSFIIKENNNISEIELSRQIANQTNAFTLWTSGSEGWTNYKYDLSYEANKLLLIFKFTINEEEDALSICQKNIHGIESKYPAIRILANNSIDLDEWTTQIQFSDLQIKIDVEDIRNFSLYSEIGQLDSTMPFYPFGTVGERGSWFVFGNEEIAEKLVHSVSLKGTWNRLPNGGYGELYKNYTSKQPITDSSFSVSCEWQDESQWNTCVNSPLSLFQTGTDSIASENAIFDFIIAEQKRLRMRSSYEYHRNKRGFYRIRLLQPSIGFGMDAYRQQFADTMIYNSGQKEKNWKSLPATPQVPLLADVSVGYKAEGRFTDNIEGDRLFRITETSSYEECFLLGSNAFNLMPVIEKQALQIGLRNLANVKQIRIYLDLQYVKEGGMIETDPKSAFPMLAWYSSVANAWYPIPQECILAEETMGLTRSGFIEWKLSSIKEYTDIGGDTIFWVRIGFNNGAAPTYRVLKGIYLNYVQVVAENGNGNSLAAKTISDLVKKDDRVASILQPVAGYGGKPVETSENISIRQTTRISTRSRAITPTDYERMILERFTDIEKVCCIPTTADEDRVRIVVFPQSENRKYPQLPDWKLAEIEHFLAPYLSIFAQVQVINPTYEPLTIRFKAVLKKDTLDERDVKRRLTRRIYKYFASWFLCSKLPSLGLQYSHEGLQAWLANDEAISKTISLEIEGGIAIKEIVDIYYKGSSLSCVLYPENIDLELLDEAFGIGQVTIGTDFKIR